MKQSVEFTIIQAQSVEIKRYLDQRNAQYQPAALSKCQIGLYLVSTGVRA